MVSPAAARPGGRRQPFGRGRHRRQGLRPRLHLENPRRRPPDAPRAATTSTPPRPGNHPAAGGDPEHKPSASPPARSCDREALRRGLPADRPAHRRQARPGPRPLPDLRRPPGPAEGRRAARHRRTAHRAGTRSRPGHPPARRLHRRDRLVLQVHLGAARLDPGKRAPRPPGRRPAGRRVLGRAGAGVPGDPAPGQPGGAGVPAGLGRDHPHRLPRHPGRRPRAGPVRARRADRHLAGCRAPAGTATPRTTSTTRSPGSPGPSATGSGVPWTP